MDMNHIIILQVVRPVNKLNLLSLTSMFLAFCLIQ